MNALAQTRLDVATVLTAAGVNASDSMPDRITPPVAVIKAGDPYLDEGKTFTDTAINLTIQVIASNGTNAVMQDALDDAICAVVTALKADQWTVKVGAPYALQTGTAEYPAVDIGITNWITL